tara:strand:- start:4405 stop:4641 length:237 start_codon:yes stop_codon:yes gene_type:complete
MAEYKVNSKLVKGLRLSSDGKKSVDFRTELSQEQLAYAYEELNIIDCIDKTEKSNEKNTSKKTSSSKAKASKEDSKEE